MTFEIALTLGIIVFALVLFATEKLRVDVVAMLVLLTVGLTGLVEPEEIFSGFSNSAVITVWAVYMVSGAMFKTGVAGIFGKFILKLSGASEVRLIVVIMLTCGIISAFINNVGAVAMLLPAVVSVARQTKIPVSKLLIPLAFSSLLGGILTLIGTPANILAASIVADRGYPPLGFFQFTTIGAVVFSVGILYMALIGRKLLPTRQSPDQVSRQLRDYISEVRVQAEGPLAGKSLFESRLGADYDLTVIAIMRDQEVITHLDVETCIQPDDLLLVEGSPENLVRAGEKLGLVLETEPHIKLNELDDQSAHIMEATLAPRSSMVNRSLPSINFRERFGFNVLAIRREGQVITQRLRSVHLQYGDSLLLQGPRHRMQELNESNEFLVLEPIEITSRRHKKMPIAVAILVSVIGLVIFAGFHISLAMVIGAVAMVLTGCLKMDEAYDSVDWRTVFLVAGMLPLGMAMESSGAAQFLADQLLVAVGGLGPLAVMGGIYLMSALITQPMSNAAAIVLMAPIALDTAEGLGVSYIPFIIAVVIGAATSFLTPVGHKANVLIFGPGGYKFFDYTKVGALLTVFLFIACMIAIPILYPF